AMISRQREPGSRRDVYLLRNDLWYEISLGRDQVLVHWANAARDGAEILGPDTPAGQRLADSHDFFAFLRQELPALRERWRAHKAQQGSPPVPPGGPSRSTPPPPGQSCPSDRVAAAAADRAA